MTLQLRMLDYVEERVHAHLRDTVGLLTDHRNKTSDTIKPVKWISWFPSVYKCYIYITLQPIQCTIALYLKKQ